MIAALTTEGSIVNLENMAISISKRIPSLRGNFKSRRIRHEPLRR